jgi:hypothetical protein
MDNFLFGAACAALGVYLIVRREQFAARTVRQQNRFWRRNYGPREVRQSERAASWWAALPSSLR